KPGTFLRANNALSKTVSAVLDTPQMQQSLDQCLIPTVKAIALVQGEKLDLQAVGNVLTGLVKSITNQPVTPEVVMLCAATHQTSMGLFKDPAQARVHVGGQVVLRVIAPCIAMIEQTMERLLGQTPTKDQKTFATTL